MALHSGSLLNKDSEALQSMASKLIFRPSTWICHVRAAILKVQTNVGLCCSQKVQQAVIEDCISSLLMLSSVGARPLTALTSTILAV